MSSPATFRSPICHVLLVCAFGATPMPAQVIAPFSNTGLPQECHAKMHELRDAGETILCVAFPPAGGNSWSVVTDKSFFNRGIPSECHAEMNALRAAGEKVLCVAFPPAGGNRWSIVTDKGFANRGIPSECHDEMRALGQAGEKVVCVAFPPAGGNRWSIVTDKSFANRNIPPACHDQMRAFAQAGEKVQWVAFPPAGGDRWSIITDKGFQNRSVLAGVQAAMSQWMLTPGALRMVALTPNGQGFSVVSHVPQISISGTTSSIPNVTSSTLTVSGQNLDRVTRVTFDGQVITSTDPSDPTKAYYQHVSSTQIKVHPPQGLSLGYHQMTAGSAWSTSQSASVQLTKPGLTRLLAPPTVSPGQPFSIYIGAGPILANQAYLALSVSNAPSVAPGIVSLGIGNAFADLVVLPQALSLPSQTGAARVVLQGVTGVRSLTVHFQALLLTRSLPLAVSNVDTTMFR